jgi:hypothetical protein
MIPGRTDNLTLLGEKIAVALYFFSPFHLLIFLAPVKKTIGKSLIII